MIKSLEKGARHTWHINKELPMCHETQAKQLRKYGPDFRLVYCGSFRRADGNIQIVLSMETSTYSRQLFYSMMPDCRLIGGILHETSIAVEADAPNALQILVP